MYRNWYLIYHTIKFSLSANILYCISVVVFSIFICRYELTGLSLDGCLAYIDSYLFWDSNFQFQNQSCDIIRNLLLFHYVSCDLFDYALSLITVYDSQDASPSVYLWLYACFKKGFWNLWQSRNLYLEVLCYRFSCSLFLFQPIDKPIATTILPSFCKYNSLSSIFEYSAEPKSEEPYTLFCLTILLVSYDIISTIANFVHDIFRLLPFYLSCLYSSS